MALKIIWTEQAQQSRMKILTYWAERTLSKKYSKKLNNLFVQYTQLLSRRPLLGKKTSMGEVRAQIIKNYILFYKVDMKTLFILDLFDTRRNPKKRVKKPRKN